MTRKSPRASVGDKARYLATVVVGSVVDLTVAMAASNLARFDLAVSATLGFLVAASLSYFAFEFIVFEGRSARFSAGRLIATLLSGLCALVTRLVVVATLGIFVPRSPLLDLAKFCAAMGCSFVVNYLLIRVTFRGPASR